MIFQKKTLSAPSAYRICCLLLCLCGLLRGATAVAASQQDHSQHKTRLSAPNRQQFKLNKTIFVTSDFERRNTVTDFAAWLRSKGISASNAYNKAPSRITFVKVTSIEGASGDNAWQITVKPKRMTVTFTTDVALQNTLDMLQGMMTTNDAGVKYFPGGVTADWGGQTGTATMQGQTVADAASEMQPVSDLETTLKRLKGKSNEIYLVLVSEDNWRMQSPSLEAAELTKTLYPTDGYYNVHQLHRIAQVAKRNHVEIIPTLELCSENRAFTSAFGHSVFSVEGMRLVRAAIEDCIKVMNPTKICIGTMSPQADMRYVKFVSDLATMLGVELIIIES